MASAASTMSPAGATSAARATNATSAASTARAAGTAGATSAVPGAAKRGAPGRAKPAGEAAGPAGVRVWGVELLRVRVEAVAELRALAGLDQLPLANCILRFRVDGAPPAVPNALRRAMVDELPGRYLAIDGFVSVEGSTDPLMFDQFVRNRLMLIPLRPQLPEELARQVTFRLDAENPTAVARVVHAGELEVASGRLAAPLFNPTTELAVLQPGRTLRVDKIYIAQGQGREHAAAQVAARARIVPLDVPRRPRAETHAQAGPHRAASDFAVSTLVARPRSHLIEATVAAVPADMAVARTIPVDACALVRDRVAFVVAALEAWVDRAPAAPGAGRAPTAGRLPQASVMFSVADGEDGVRHATLVVRGETMSVGALLEACAFEAEPDVAFVAAICPPHEGALRLSLSSRGDVRALAVRAGRRAMAYLDAVREGLLAAPIAMHEVTAAQIRAEWAAGDAAGGGLAPPPRQK